MRIATGVSLFVKKWKEKTQDGLTHFFLLWQSVREVKWSISKIHQDLSNNDFFNTLYQGPKMKHLQIFMNFVYKIRIRDLFIKQQNPKFDSDWKNVREIRSILASEGVNTSYLICTSNGAYKKIIKCCGTRLIFDIQIWNFGFIFLIW